MAPPGGSRPTLKSIALAAGVHPSTVSRALRDEAGSRIPAETLRRIREVAAEVGYRPDPWARSLRTHRTMLLGMVMPRLTDIILAQMFEAAQVRAREHGYAPLTVAGTDGGLDRSLLRSLSERRVDGLVIATAVLDDPDLDELAREEVPFVLLNRASRDHLVVRGDDEEGAYLATRHLLDLGHRRIAHLAGPQSVSTGRWRLSGYRRALREAGVGFDKALVGYTMFDAGSSLKAADHLLDASNPPTAVFCVNDVGALATMASARRHGLRVPRDLSVVGYNDTEVSALLPIPLTTVRVPLYDMGRFAVDRLVDRLNGGRAESVVVKPELMVRESTCSPVDAATAPD